MNKSSFVVAALAAASLAELSLAEGSDTHTLRAPLLRRLQDEMTDEEIKEQMKMDREKAQMAMFRGEKAMEVRAKKMLKWMSDNTTSDVTGSGWNPWPNGQIRWCTDSFIDQTSLQAFMVAAKQYEDAFPGCIKFVKVGERSGNCEGYPEQDALYLRSTRNDGCQVNGYVGTWPANLRRAWGRHHINLAPGGCTYGVSTAIHEIGHALGMEHEQNRSDRDKYVRVNWQNIAQGWQSQFKLSQKSHVSVEYDFNSVMHYDRRQPQVHARGSRTEDLMTPIQCPATGCPEEFGNKVGLSNADHQQIKQMYQCGAKTASWTEQTTCVSAPETSARCSGLNQWQCYRAPSCWSVRVYTGGNTGGGGDGGDKARGQGGDNGSGDDDEEEEEEEEEEEDDPVVMEKQKTTFYKADYSFSTFAGQKLFSMPGFNNVNTLAQLAKFVKDNVPGAKGFYAPSQFPSDPRYRYYAQALTDYKQAPLQPHRPLYVLNSKIVTPPPPPPKTKYYKASHSFSAFKGTKLSRMNGFESVNTLDEMAEFIKANVPSAKGFYVPPQFSARSAYRKYARAFTSFTQARYRPSRPLFLFGTEPKTSDWDWSSGSSWN